MQNLTLFKIIQKALDLPKQVTELNLKFNSKNVKFVEIDCEHLFVPRDPEKGPETPGRGDDCKILDESVDYVNGVARTTWIRGNKKKETEE